VPTDHYSYIGDKVCQDGVRSYYTDGHVIPCGISVYNQDYWTYLTWDDSSIHHVQGVLGHITKNYIGALPGDSGAMVFAEPSAGQTTRDARGQVSATGSDSTYNILFWVEAPDILASAGLKLNPYT
jgi:hypothetical protein